jgi:hypothetical protein
MIGYGGERKRKRAQDAVDKPFNSRLRDEHLYL